MKMILFFGTIIYFAFMKNKLNSDWFNNKKIFIKTSWQGSLSAASATYFLQKAEWPYRPFSSGPVGHCVFFPYIY